jgi:hypothetical protein
VIGRGAFNNEYAFFRPQLHFCTENGYPAPDFMPISVRSYEGMKKLEEAVFGLDYYVREGLIRDGMHLVFLEDGVDTGGTIRFLVDVLNNHYNLKHITWEVVCWWIKLPRAFQEWPDLEHRVTYLFKIPAEKGKQTLYDWIDQSHEGERAAHEMEAHFRNKDVVNPGIFDIMFGSKPRFSVPTIPGLFTPNEAMKAAFALARDIIEAIPSKAGLPYMVDVVFPDQDFNESPYCKGAPGVVVHEMLKNYSRYISARSGSPDAELGADTEVEFGVITKGPKRVKREWIAQRPAEGKRLLVVANMLPADLTKAKIKDITGASEVITAAIFHQRGKGENPDFFLHKFV